MMKLEDTYAIFLPQIIPLGPLTYTQLIEKINEAEMYKIFLSFPREIIEEQRHHIMTGEYLFQSDRERDLAHIKTGYAPIEIIDDLTSKMYMSSSNDVFRLNEPDLPREIDDPDLLYIGPDKKIISKDNAMSIYGENSLTVFVLAHNIIGDGPEMEYYQRPALYIFCPQTEPNFAKISEQFEIAKKDKREERYIVLDPSMYSNN
ncbi:MAG: hypothetical protein NDI94_07075 [Candidatus Woesearchaeota archaeon]|nr:hypothetical protein [Candidatus Woesearchaeota archaeon]